jgi:hypothetical protein
VLISKIIFKKLKKYHFNIFLNKKYFKKRSRWKVTSTISLLISIFVSEFLSSEEDRGKNKNKVWMSTSKTEQCIKRYHYNSSIPICLTTAHEKRKPIKFTYHIKTWFLFHPISLSDWLKNNYYFLKKLFKNISK